MPPARAGGIAILNTPHPAGRGNDERVRGHRDGPGRVGARRASGGPPASPAAPLPARALRVGQADAVATPSPRAPRAPRACADRSAVRRRDSPSCDRRLGLGGRRAAVAHNAGHRGARGERLAPARSQAAGVHRPCSAPACGGAAAAALAFARRDLACRGRADAHRPDRPARGRLRAACVCAVDATGGQFCAAPRPKRDQPPLRAPSSPSARGLGAVDDRHHRQLRQDDNKVLRRLGALDRPPHARDPRQLQQLSRRDPHDQRAARMAPPRVRRGDGHVPSRRHRRAVRAGAPEDRRDHRDRADAPGAPRLD